MRTKNELTIPHILRRECTAEVRENTRNTAYVRELIDLLIGCDSCALCFPAADVRVCVRVCVCVCVQVRRCLQWCWTSAARASDADTQEKKTPNSSNQW